MLNHLFTTTYTLYKKFNPKKCQKFIKLIMTKSDTILTLTNFKHPNLILKNKVK